MKTQELANLVHHQTVYHTLREAIDGASEPLYLHLPLLTAAFTNFDVAEALGEKGAIVVAEEVVRVPSPNRPPWNRVDFFCYKVNGDVVRHHSQPAGRSTLSSGGASQPAGGTAGLPGCASDRGGDSDYTSSAPYPVPWIISCADCDDLEKTAMCPMCDLPCCRTCQDAGHCCASPEAEGGRLRLAALPPDRAGWRNPEPGAAPGDARGVPRRREPQGRDAFAVAVRRALDSSL